MKEYLSSAIIFPNTVSKSSSFDISTEAGSIFGVSGVLQKDLYLLEKYQDLIQRDTRYMCHLFIATIMYVQGNNVYV